MNFFRELYSPIDKSSGEKVCGYVLLCLYVITIVVAVSTLLFSVCAVAA